jgi:hypothetical protein
VIEKLESALLDKEEARSLAGFFSRRFSKSREKKYFRPRSEITPNGVVSFWEEWGF